MNSIKKLLFIYIIISIVNSLFVNAVTKTVTGSGYYGWSQNIWTPTGTPGIEDDVIINGPNLEIDTQGVNITVNSINLGPTSTKNAFLDLDSFVTVTNNLTVTTNSQLTCFAPPVPAPLTVDVGGYLNVNGALLMYQGSEYTFSGTYFYLRSGSIMVNNVSKTTFTATTVTLVNSQLQNKGFMHFAAITTLLTGMHFFFPGSQTLFTGSDSLRSVNTGYFEFQSNSQALATQNVILQNSVEFIVLENATFSMINQQFNISDPVNGVNTFLQLSESAQFIVIGGNVVLDGAFTNLFHTSKLIIQGGNFTTNNTIIVRDQSTLSLTASSNYNANAFVMANANGLITITNSKMSISDNNFGLFDQSKGIFNGSTLEITVRDGVRNMGVFNSATLDFNSNSIFSVDGTFAVYDSANLTVESSECIVKYIFFLDNNGKCLITQDSLISILNIFAVRGSGYFLLDNSTLQVVSNITFYEDSTFLFKDSDVSVDGFFTYTNEDAVHKSIIENSLLTIHGYFYNTGNLDITSNSQVHVFTNFTTYGNLIIDDSVIILEQGIFNTNMLFDGSNSNITVKNGLIIVEDSSTFNCVNCDITIEVGHFQQGTGSTVNLNNTVFYNKGGIVQANGVIQLEGGGITNSGEFILKSDIIPSGNSLVNIENNGVFTVNGDSKSTISTGFVNNAQVNLDSDTSFSSLTQTQGTITLNDVIVESSTVISLNGGDLVGNGEVRSNVDNNQGTLGSKKKSDIVTIIGDYQQSNSSQIYATVGTAGISKFSISGNATLDGTIVIRIDEDIVNNAVENSTTDIITHNEVTGSFKTIVIVVIDKSGTETQISNDCKVKTQHSSKSFALLVTPDDSRSECNTNNTSNSSESNKPKLSKGAIIGIVVGVVGAAGIICAIYFFKHKTDGQILKKKLNSLPLDSPQG